MVAPALVAIGKAVAPSLIDAIANVIDRFVPDPEQKQKALMEIVGVLQASDQAQAEINAAEAATGNLFIGGWRPALGWLGVLGVAYVWVAQPTLEWLSINFGWLPPPKLDVSELMTLLVGMLGLGAYRSLERIRGVIPPGK